MTMSGDENRSDPRRSSMYSVVVEVEGRRISGKIRDYSDHGCRLRLDEPLTTDGGSITVTRGESSMPGTVAWQDGKSIGIRFPHGVPDAMFAPSFKRSSSDRWLR